MYDLIKLGKSEYVLISEDEEMQIKVNYDSQLFEEIAAFYPSEQAHIYQKKYVLEWVDYQLKEHREECGLSGRPKGSPLSASKTFHEFVEWKHPGRMKEIFDSRVDAHILEEELPELDELRMQYYDYCNSNVEDYFGYDEMPEGSMPVKTLDAKREGKRRKR